MKETVSEGMQNELRLLLATEAYSMGVDVNDICRIVHAGPPSSMESKFCMLYYLIIILAFFVIQFIMLYPATILQQINKQN